MTATSATGGPVVIDLSALALAGRSEKRIARYARDFAEAMERHRPDLVGRYLLPPDLRLPDGLAALLSGKVAVVGSAGAVPESARVFHSMWAMDLARSAKEIWPAEVEHRGLRFSATVHEGFLSPLSSAKVDGGRQRRRARVRCEVLRQADALLAISAETKRELVERVGADPSVVTVVRSGEAWQDVVARSAEVFEALASRGRRRWRRDVRVAFVSPFPPIPSGVARYSARLVEALSDELAAVAPGARIDCFTDGLNRVAAAPLVPAVGGECFDARQFVTVEHALGGYDRVVYVLGNSEFHSSALAALRRRSGIVMAHDVRMSGLLRHSRGRRGAVPGGLEGAVRRAYGDAPSVARGESGGIEDTDLEQAGLLCIGDIAPHADRLLVLSEAARRLAAADIDPELTARIAVLPYAMALEQPELEAVADARAASARARPLVVSFGIVDPSKLPHALVEAVASVSAERELDLAFVGPVSDALAEELAALAAGLGMGERVRVTGHVERSTYLGFLGTATVAVQPRASFAGEASGAVGDCLAAGVATIVSDIGWMGDLPDDTVLKVDTSTGAAGGLAAALRSLLDDPDRRSSMAERAAGFAAAQTFSRAAAALVALFDLAGAPTDGSAHASVGV
ncbi:MAG: glycosyltransferase [Acidimicrobiales bacterium]|jgi:glycosyltransferase involved in cell wall biosynthesis